MQETCFQWRAWKAEAGALSGRAIGSRTHKTACRLGILLAVAVMAIPSSAREAAIVQGRQIAAQGTATGVAPCASCHGARGEGAAAFPRLAGTGQSYLRAQLEAFAEGSRKNPVMQPFAQKLSPAERTAVAAYFSSLPPPFTAEDVAQAAPADTGPWLATRGRWVNQLPACAQCHGPGGSGVDTSFPPLAGLPAAYIAGQLQAWKAGTRPPGPLALMQGIAQRLSNADITAVSSYYAGLAPASARTAASAAKEVRP